MTLQASGAIKFSELRAEFGGSVPDVLDEYYRNGSFVHDVAANSGIPTSGAISLSDFYSSEFGINPLMTRGDLDIGSIPIGRGYSNNPFGGWDAVGGGLAVPNTWEGDLVEEIYSTGTTLNVTINGVHAQTYFTTFVCSLGTFATASASAFSDTTHSTWSWSGAGALSNSGTETVEMT